MPSKEAIMSATINNKIDWDAIESFHQGEDQSLESFNEQKHALNTFKKQLIHILL